MEHIKILRATPDDAEGIQTLTKDSSKGMYEICGWSEKEIADHFPIEKIQEGTEKLRKSIFTFTEGDILFVAKDENEKVIGCCFAEKQEHINTIEAVYILPEFQRSGLGKKLYDKAFELLNKNNDTILSVFSLNSKAMNFYKKLGFEETGKKIFDERFVGSTGEMLEITEMKLIGVKKVSVVIINYNNARFLDRCIQSVKENNPFEIIVIDDSSTDNSLEIINKYPVLLIKNDLNLGPVKSRNRGAKIAQGEYILFLDSDTMLDKNYVKVLTEFLDADLKIGVVSGKVVEQKNKRMWYNFGYDPNQIRDLLGYCFSKFIERYPIRFIKFISYPFTLNFASDKVREVDWVIEMGFMTRKNIFEKVGGLDENYFMFFEGPDYCRSIRKQGLKVLYVPTAVLEHLNGNSHETKRNSFFKASRKYYFKKW